MSCACKVSVTLSRDVTWIISKPQMIKICIGFPLFPVLTHLECISKIHRKSSHMCARCMQNEFVEWWRGHLNIPSKSSHMHARWLFCIWGTPQHTAKVILCACEVTPCMVGGYSNILPKVISCEQVMVAEWTVCLLTMQEVSWSNPSNLPLLQCREHYWPPCWPLYSQQVLHQRWISGIHGMQATKHASKGSTLALKPRGDVIRSPKQGYQWPHEKDSCPSKILKKKKSHLMCMWDDFLYDGRTPQHTPKVISHAHEVSVTLSRDVTWMMSKPHMIKICIGFPLYTVQTHLVCICKIHVKSSRMCARCTDKMSLWNGEGNTSTYTLYEMKMLLVDFLCNGLDTSTYPQAACRDEFVRSRKINLAVFNLKKK